MGTRSQFLFLFALILSFATVLPAQQNQTSSAASNVAALPFPRLIKFSGTLLDEQGRPLNSPVGVTFAFYAQQYDGAPLWMETQNVEIDAKGNYAVLLGANSAAGVPAELFTTGEARWLGVQAEHQPEQPRILLVSVPYSYKAGDAETLGGLPPSAFALANSAASRSTPSSSTAPVTAFASSPVAAATSAASLGGTGTANFIPLWTPDGSTLGNSILFQSTTTNVNVNGSFSLPAIGTATASLGQNSRPLDFFASSFNSTSPGSAVAQHFRWQAEPAANDTTSPSGKLNLLFAGGTGTPAETGLSISNKGLISFASGQTFPGVAELGVSNTFVGNENVTGTMTATTTSSTSNAVKGFVSSTSGTAAGVYGVSSSLNGYGVEGLSSNVGVYGNSANIGVLGAGSSYGVQGAAALAGGVGILGTGTTGVEGKGAVGVEGIATSGGLSGLFQSGPLKVVGNGNDLLVGDPGCGSGYVGIGVTKGSLAGCTNYALLGGSKGDTFINSNGTASIHFRSNNNELAIIDNSGNVKVIGQNGGGNLTVEGKVKSGNVAGQVTANNQTILPLGCTGVLSTGNSSCDVPNMSLTETTGGGPVLIMGNVNGVFPYDTCLSSDFYLVMDGKIVAQSYLFWDNGNMSSTVMMISLQFPPTGTHKFEIQGTDDIFQCGGSNPGTGISSVSAAGTSGSSRTLLVREL
jgi:hypothetical protein